MDFNDPKEIDDLQVFDDLKEISIGSMNFNDPVNGTVIPPSLMVLFVLEATLVFKVKWASRCGICSFMQIKHFTPHVKKIIFMKLKKIKHISKNFIP